MFAFSPPVHSTWATFLPASSADEATDCASSTFVGSVPGLAPLPWKANDVDLSNVCRVSKNVLFVLPCTPGYAPVASVYQPCAGVGREALLQPVRPGDAGAHQAGVGRHHAALRVRFIRSGRMPSEA